LIKFVWTNKWFLSKLQENKFGFDLKASIDLSLTFIYQVWRGIKSQEVQIFSQVQVCM